jgi:nitrile hydratase subunit beta
VKFAPGQAVRVSARAHAGHHRTPGYVKGKRGIVERAHVGEFTNPETRAYGDDGTPARRLYLVRFDQAELWPGYAGAEEDHLLTDVFEHWLEEDA